MGSSSSIRNWERTQDDEANIACARRCVEELRPFSTGGSYLNFAGFFEDGDEQVRRAVGERNFARLAAVKETYDPDGLFVGRRAARR